MSKYKNTYKIELFIYAIICSLLISIATLVLERQPVFLQIENAIYDTFQRILTVDDLNDKSLERINSELEDLIFINLDSIYFNHETNRVKKDSLAYLLEKLQRSKKMKGILLDYLFYPSNPKNHCNDSILINSIQALNDLIVLPYSITLKDIPTWGELTSEMITMNDSLLVTTKHMGYLAAMPSIGDECYRYNKLKIEDGSQQSVTHALLEVILNDKTEIILKDKPLNFEINYVLRNKHSKAVPVIDASQLIKWPKAQIAERLKGKIIFIGLFDSLYNKYGMPIDKFKTPVQLEMPGIYILINTYLNVISATQIKRASAPLIFFYNFMIALLGVLYYQHLDISALKSWKRMMSEILICAFCVLLSLFFLFQHTSIKFPFVLSTFFVVRNHSIYIWFKDNIISISNR